MIFNIKKLLSLLFLLVLSSCESLGNTIPTEIDPFTEEIDPRIYLSGEIDSFTGDSVFRKLMLFSGDTYLGCLNCSSLSSDSICNPFGTYGNSFSGQSIWNSFGTHGNSFSPNSPWNSFSPGGPVIVDEDGNSYGRFSINTFSGFSQSGTLNEIYEKMDGDLSEVRDLFCG